MNQRIFPRRWIILVLLLMISITFLFLQLLSLKAIDNTVSFIQKIISVYTNFKVAPYGSILQFSGYLFIDARCHVLLKLISRFRVLQSLRELLPYHNQKYLVLVSIMIVSGCGRFPYMQSIQHKSSIVKDPRVHKGVAY